MTTPRPERVLRYHTQQALNALDAIARQQRLVNLLEAAGWSCPDCEAPDGELCFPFCLRYRKDRP